MLKDSGVDVELKDETYIKIWIFSGKSLSLQQLRDTGFYVQLKHELYLCMSHLNHIAMIMRKKRAYGFPLIER